MNNRMNAEDARLIQSLLNDELHSVQFEGRERVLAKAIEHKEGSWMSRLLNYEVAIPIPVAAIAVSLIMFLTVMEFGNREVDYDPIYVIEEGGGYEVY